MPRSTRVKQLYCPGVLSCKRFDAAALLAVLALATACASQAPSDAPLGRVIEHFEMLEQANQFSGAVLVARGDTILMHRGFGYSDWELGSPVELEHIFRIGSLSKPITAAAVLISADQGRLSLSDPICNFLDPCPPSWGSVTVEHALTHTSGIADHFGDLEAVPVEDTADEAHRVLTDLGDEPLLSEPGEEYAYRNFNYVILGLVLEETFDEPWEAVLERLMFKPLGLDSIGYDEVFSIVPGRVHGYDRDENGQIVKIEYDDHAAYAPGGLRSTIGDFFLWSRAVIAGDLLSEELRQKAFTPYRGSYGYGWQVRQFFDRDVYNHTGEIDGFSSHIAYYPADDLTIIVFSNIVADAAILRACEVAYVLFEWAELPETQAAWAVMAPQQTCGV